MLRIFPFRFVVHVFKFSIFFWGRFLYSFFAHYSVGGGPDVPIGRFLGAGIVKVFFFAREGTVLFIMV